MNNPYIRRNGKASAAASKDSTKKETSTRPPLPPQELQELLSKLRPFQREAYEFATQGIVSTRLGSSDNFRYDPDLLGKGRIGIFDEMGLGQVKL